MNIPDPIHVKLARAIAGAAPVARGGVNSTYDSKFSTLSDVLAVIKPALAAEGLVLSQPFTVQRGCVQSPDGFEISLRNEFTDLATSQTHVEDLRWPIVSADAHVIASAVTYARRISLISIFALMQFDDDGNAASPKAQERAKHGSGRPPGRPPKVAEAAVKAADPVAPKAELAKPVEPTPLSEAANADTIPGEGWENTEMPADLLDHALAEKKNEVAVGKWREHFGGKPVSVIAKAEIAARMLAFKPEVIEGGHVAAWAAIARAQKALAPA